MCPLIAIVYIDFYCAINKIHVIHVLMFMLFILGVFIDCGIGQTVEWVLLPSIGSKITIFK